MAIRKMVCGNEDCPYIDVSGLRRVTFHKVFDSPASIVGQPIPCPVCSIPMSPVDPDGWAYDPKEPPDFVVRTRDLPPKEEEGNP